MKFSALVLIGLLATTSFACEPVSACQQEVPKSADGQAWLQSAGLNLKLLDDIRNGSWEAFVEDEYELFNALMRTVASINESPPSAAPHDFELIEALQRPGSYRGAYVRLRGTVRRVVPIRITDQALSRESGLQNYYHVDFFVSTQQTSFRLKDREGGVTYANTFGLTLILPELPSSIAEADPREQVTISGFYLKNWQHKTLETRDVSDGLRRPNPIVFGLPATLHIQPAATSEGGGIAGLIGWFWVGFLALLGGLAFWMLRDRRDDRKSPTEQRPNFDGLQDLPDS